MFVGHYAAGFAAKVASPATPLWLLLLGAQLVDLVWVALVLSDVEQLRLVPGFTQSNDLDNIYMPYSHGIVWTVVWVLAAALVYGLCARHLFAKKSAAAHPVGVRRVRSSTGVIGSIAAVVFVVGSHWLMDLIVHVPDLPVSDQTKVGLGLWNYRWLAFELELVLVVGTGFWLASRCGQPAYLFASALGVMCIANYFGPQPTTELQVLFGALAVYIVVAAVAYWGERRGWFVQRHR